MPHSLLYTCIPKADSKFKRYFCPGIYGSAPPEPPYLDSACESLYRCLRLSGMLADFVGQQEPWRMRRVPLHPHGASFPHPVPPVQTAWRRVPPGCEPLRLAAAARWGRRNRRRQGVAASGAARSVNMPFILPIGGTVCYARPRNTVALVSMVGAVKSSTGTEQGGLLYAQLSEKVV